MRLLFTFAYWHGMAGLHMHTEDTVGLLDDLTTILGQRLREFKATTCEKYPTRELKRETAKRLRQSAKAKSAAAAQPAKGKAPFVKAKTSSVKDNMKGATAIQKDEADGAQDSSRKGKSSSARKAPPRNSQVSTAASPDTTTAAPALAPTQASSSSLCPPVLSSAEAPSVQPSSTVPTETPDRKFVKFNLNTYKMHALGDYVDCIRTMGTADSVTTRAVRALLLAIDSRDTDYVLG